MLTDEQARRFCECGWCCGGDVYAPDFSVRACPVCSGAGIDPDKRKDLEELLREAKFDAWSAGYDRGWSDAHVKNQRGYPPPTNNPHAKDPTNG